MGRYIFFLIVLFTVTGVNAQDKLYKKYFVEAGEFFMNDNYDKAIPVYLNMISKGLGNSHIYFNLGFSYLMTPGEMENAIFYLEKAADNVSPDFKEGSVKEVHAPIDAVYYLAKAYRLSGRFDEAIPKYLLYKSFLSVKDTYNHDYIAMQVATCNNARQMMQQPVEVSINPLPQSINSSDNEYCPVISHDGKLLFYTSVQMVYDKDYGEYLPFALLFSVSNDNGNWAKPKEITQKLGSDGNFYTSSLSSNGKTLVLYISEFGNGNLFYTENENNRWSPLKPFPRPINTKSNETHACFTPDEKGLYFISDRSGGIGGKDIWYTETDEKGKWSEPVNLGMTINTQFDEETPFLTTDGNTLFFSSEGHNSMGGFDVFQSEKVGKAQWSAPVNLGYPVNTLDDDWFFVPFRGKSRAIMPYTKFSGEGRSDLYELIFPIPEEPEMPLPDTSPVLAETKTDTAVHSQPEVIQPEITQSEVNNVPQTNTEQPVVTEQPAVSQNNQVNEPSTTEIVNSEPAAPVIQQIKVVASITLTDNNIADDNFRVKVTEAGLYKGSMTYENYSGKFSILLPPGRYKIEAEGVGYYNASANLTIPEGYNRPELELNLRLDPLSVASGEYYSIKSIFFDYCSSEISRDGQVEIEKLYRLMNENPSLYVEVTGHADSKGSELGNKTISERRAANVVNYLSEKGIDPMRFVAKGLGNSLNVAINTNPDGTDNPEGRSYNRRADIKILRSNNDKISIEPPVVPERLRLVKPLYYTVMLMQSPKPLSPGYFTKYVKDSIPNVWLYQTTDNYIYAVGQFKSKSRALSILNHAIDAGFSNAVIITSDDLQVMQTQAIARKKLIQHKPKIAESDLYTIQLIALRNPVDMKFFNSIDGVNEYKGNDGIFRYYVGQIKGLKEAKQFKTEIAAKGFPDAFIVPLNRYKN